MNSHAHDRKQVRFLPRQRGLLFSLLGLSLFCSTAQAQEFSVMGFGSFVGAKLMEGDGYIANFPNLGIYGKNGSNNFGPTDHSWINPESRLGIQAIAKLSDSTKVTGQVMMRGTANYSPNMEWFYLSHEINDKADVQIGKMRLPVYMFSDKMDVGFAYPWVRVPSDTYSLDSVNYSGARLNYVLRQPGTNLRLSLWSGTQDDQNSKLMSYLFDTRIDRKHRFTGVVADLTHGNGQIRVSYTTDAMRQSTPNPAMGFRNENFDEVFIDVAGQYQIGELTLMGEWNQDKPFYKSWYLSAIYQMGRYAVYGTYSRFILDEPWEKHNQTSFGIKYDLAGNMALKMDVTRFRDQGMNPFTGRPNPVIKIQPGHSTLVTVALDFVF